MMRNNRRHEEPNCFMRGKGDFSLLLLLVVRLVTQEVKNSFIELTQAFRANGDVYLAIVSQNIKV